jgi:hypothetical protein
VITYKHFEVARALALGLVIFVSASFMAPTVAMGEGKGPVKRSAFPTEANEGPPFYARIDPYWEVPVPQDGDWAAIVFYRAPECVPTDFNLLLFFDFPAFDPATGFYPGFLRCPDLRVHGFELWPTARLEDPAPRMILFQGEGDTPVWFVLWSELKPVVNGGHLTMLDLEDTNLMPSLRKGTAHFFSETLHVSGGAVVPKILMIASGTLADGTDFKLRFMRNPGNNSARITFSE